MSFKIINGYKFEQRIFKLAIALMIILILTAWGIGGFFNPIKPPVYVSCPIDAEHYCDNPYFTGARGQDWSLDMDTLENMPFLPQGFEYGEKPNWLLTSLPHLFFLLLVMAFLFNHIKNNKRLPK